jgi:GxxExxY protein
MSSLAVVALPRVSQITGRIVTGAMKVHSQLGPGLLESAYEACLAHELRKEGLQAARQVELPVVYDGERIDLGYLIDLLVEDLIVVELKCVECINPVHQAQLLSYIRLSGKHVGLLINFHVAHLRNGIKRMVDGRNWEK